MARRLRGGSLCTGWSGAFVVSGLNGLGHGSRRKVRGRRRRDSHRQVARRGGLSLDLLPEFLQRLGALRLRQFVITPQASGNSLHALLRHAAIARLGFPEIQDLNQAANHSAVLIAITVFETEELAEFLQ